MIMIYININYNNLSSYIRGLDNFSPTETSASFRLKKMYTKYLLAYEKHIFNFLPIPTKKHRYGHSTTPPATTTIQTQTTGIQNSAIFPQATLQYTTNEKVGKRPVKPAYQPLYNDHMNSSLLATTRFTPGAGIGLINNNLSWEKEGQKARNMNMKRSYDMATHSTITDEYGNKREEINRGDIEIGGHHLRGTVTPAPMYRRPMRTQSSHSSPVPQMLSPSQGMQTRLQAKRERLDISRSPMITGEDPEGAAGLRALMTLRTSLSPPLQAAEGAKWDALVNAATNSKTDKIVLPNSIASIPKKE